MEREKGNREGAASRRLKAGARLEPMQPRWAVAARHGAGGEGSGDDSYLDEHFHVHERLRQDGETGAQEHLTGRVRHDGTRGRTDRPSHQATEPVADHVQGPPAPLARPRSARARARARTGAPGPRPRPLPLPEKRQALANGRWGAGRGQKRMRSVVGLTPSTGSEFLLRMRTCNRREGEAREWQWGGVTLTAKARSEE